MWSRYLATKGLPGTSLNQRIDAPSKLVLNAGHEVERGDDHLLRR
jgi:hypothetical protein